jgi:hypothetical protein
MSQKKTGVKLSEHGRETLEHVLIDLQLPEKNPRCHSKAVNFEPQQSGRPFGGDDPLNLNKFLSFSLRRLMAA